MANINITKVTDYKSGISGKWDYSLIKCTAFFKIAQSRETLRSGEKGANNEDINNYGFDEIAIGYYVKQ